MGEGEIERLMVEGDHGSMIVVPVSDEASIAVLLEKETKVGAGLWAFSAFSKLSSSVVQKRERHRQLRR